MTVSVDKMKCGAKTRAGGQCGRPAGWGCPTPGYGRCKLHGGLSPSGKIAAQKLVARSAALQFALVTEDTIDDIDPSDVLLEELSRTRRKVAFYEMVLSELSTHPEADRFVPGDGEREGHWLRGAAGLYGWTRHLSGTPTGEAKPHVLVQLSMQERRHLREVAAECVKAGIELKKMAVIEDAAQQLAQLVRAIFDDSRLPLEPAQRVAAMEVAAEHVSGADYLQLARGSG